ncbi:hypothetical protein BC831DRAFT_477866 [Entophlyctis helioformis]|nr:hypothetical protein BC831DRAFT_477866 [Entophlyctis helioformis]
MTAGPRSDTSDRDDATGGEDDAIRFPNLIVALNGHMYGLVTVSQQVPMARARDFAVQSRSVVLRNWTSSILYFVCEMAMTSGEERLATYGEHGLTLGLMDGSRRTSGALAVFAEPVWREPLFAPARPAETRSRARASMADDGPDPRRRRPLFL